MHRSRRHTERHIGKRTDAREILSDIAKLKYGRHGIFSGHPAPGPGRGPAPGEGPSQTPPPFYLPRQSTPISFLTAAILARVIRLPAVRISFSGSFPDLIQSYMFTAVS